MGSSSLHDGIIDFFSGSVAGMGQTAVGQPFDTVKTRLQIEGRQQRFRGPLDCAIQTVRHEGFASLYKVLFASYSQAKEWQRTDAQDHLALHQIAFAGGFAELLKIRLQGQYTPLAQHASHLAPGQASQTIYRGPFQLARTILTTHGVRRGLLRGFWITMLREIPANMGFYTGFEVAKRWLAAQRNVSPDQLGIGQLLMAGACGGISYWSCCYPLDVIKSTVQYQTKPLRSLSYIQETIRELYQQGGLRAFTKGFTPTLLRSLPAAATTFSVYELTSRFLRVTV
ncbi:hypothetical protein IWQ62_002336 [Dispira parvispora]|uniref:Uncharacterized protein n=1 Tax=Dispira parvispora TaxID=1520584 RepID=A0A9W8E3Y3_9FUNG|nr:hypothetical protein IWQ62_002336 [Dispira parvispora]